MAGTPVPEEGPKLGWKATVAGFVFAAAVLGGFSAATAVSYEDKGYDDHSDDHGEEHGDDHGDDHSEESDHDEDDHSE